jgi:phosphohistidine swiveling domain-containing protein
MSKDEILDMLRNGMDDRKLAMIKKRQNGCFMLNGAVYPRDELNDVLEAHGFVFEKISGDRDSIKGTSAFGGVVRGIVKIVNGFDELDKIQSGDILVTQMTNPKYSPAIERSLAVVTDEGGTLCHAAITARELKKPCIIGTKIATQVLKDGDMVEVDANIGVVKKIK